MNSPMRAMALQAGYDLPTTGLGTLPKTEFDKLPGPQQDALVTLSEAAGRKNIDIEANEGARVTVNGNVVKIDTTGLDISALDQAAHEAGFSGFAGVYKFPPEAQVGPTAQKRTSPWAWLLGAAAVGAVVYVGTRPTGSSRSNPVSSAGFFGGASTFRVDGRTISAPVWSYESKSKLYDVAVFDGTHYYRTNMGPWSQWIADPIHREIEKHFATQIAAAGSHKNPAARRGADDLDTFTLSYIETALWSTTDNADDSGGEPLDKNYGIDDIAPDTLEQMKKDAETFQRDYAHALLSGTDDQAGHDFWLTRERHGAGFWDGDWPEPDATTLTDAAHGYGSFDLYVGDDGLIHGN